MKFTLLTIVLLVFVTVNADTVKHTGGSSKIEPQSIEKAANTSYVVNHEFCYSCLSEEENEEKESLEEVPTYAQLKRDPVLTFHPRSQSVPVSWQRMEVNRCSSTCLEMPEINGWDHFCKLMARHHSSIPKCQM